MKNAGATDAQAGARVAGLVLAAGAGRRMGRPKALVRDPDGIPWVVGTSRLLAESGCSPVVVVIGAAATETRAALLNEPVDVVEATDWTEGKGASLRAGLHQTSGLREVDAVMVVPVDVPGLTPAVVRRVAERARVDGLVRATYQGQPGHPVVIGRAHWDGVIVSARGDEGGRTYLRDHRAELVECADLTDGSDVDTPDDLPSGHS
ncbi:nucleotidyltransferase family protein [Kribbella sp. HUAS MG21]|uniref:Nucleotidyltransferase family protein n=1 Tax=Kribbella sp. HUAS MG21 TaxID=3160966 RepID=A0AAU7TCV0_9ACTN